MASDLIVLAACQNTKFALLGMLNQSERLRIRPISFTIIVHPEHDPGCVRTSAEVLRSQQRLYEKALVMCDYEGSGAREESAIDVEKRIEQRLSVSGWAGRSAAVVIDPELEAWVWSDSPHVEEVLGWRYRIPTLRAWLVDQGFLSTEYAKPAHPKEAVLAALKAANLRRSSAIYASLARSVSFERCSDRAFARLKDVLRNWFPQ
ncbi:MAG: hypothetical protein K2Y37_18480 [Pirellulales bacterium]|nr:hypothetical protein [Pirellulales bacterium]